MSFFDDFLNQFSVDDVKDEVKISCVLNLGVLILGKVIVENFDSNCVILKHRKNFIKVFGFDLKIKTLAKCEILIVGNVKSIVSGD